MKYVTPVMAKGAMVNCQIRGLVKIVGLSEGPIPWPTGERNGVQQLIVYEGLATAIRRETTDTVASLWGVPVETVKEWQATLAVTPIVRIPKVE